MHATAPETVLEGRYTLVEPAPDRGLGEAWRARDGRREGTIVQIKFLRPTGGEFDPGALKAVRALRALRHPAIPSVLNHGVHAGRPWVASEDVRGDSLGTLLDGARTADALLDLALIRATFDAVTSALGAAHAAQIPVFQGALAPGSVIALPRSPRGPAGALLDLGLAPWLDIAAAATARSARLLVARAPELSAGGSASVATDVFALGALLTELLALPAAAGETLVAVTSTRRRPDVGGGVWTVLERAMAIAPEQRFPDVNSLASALSSAWTEAPSAHGAGARATTRATGGSLLETVLPTARPGPRLDVSMAPAAASAPAEPLAPILGAMPALPSHPAPPVHPPDWENPWATAVIQGKAPLPQPAADDALNQTIIDEGALEIGDEGMTLLVPEARPMARLGSLSATLDIRAVPAASTSDAPLGETLVAATPRAPRVSPAGGTLIATAPRGYAAGSVTQPGPAAPVVQPAPPPAPTLPTALLAAGFVLAFVVVAFIAYRIGAH